MTITSETFEALLQCPTKAYSIYHRVSGEVRAITQLVKDDDEAFYRNASARLRAIVPADQTYVGTPSLEAMRQRLYSVVVDCTFMTPALAVQAPGFNLKIVVKDNDQSSYIPFRFCSSDRISNEDKLLLAFDAFVFSQVVGIAPCFGELLIGQQFRRVRIALTPLYPK